MDKKDFVKLPMESIPRIFTAGRFYHEDKVFLRKYYTKDSLSLHLYDYPGTIKIGSLTFHFEPGAITIIPPFTEYSYDLPHAGYHYCIHFRIENRNHITNEKLPLFTQTGNIEYERMKAKLKEVIEFYSLKENNKTAAVAAGITLAQMFCCISIKKNCPENTFSSNSLAAVSKAASIIEANLHLPLSISAVAKKAGLSQNYLARLFKEHYKMTLSGYQTRKRMEFAGYLLLNSNLKIKEIGARCGIPDAQHFNKLFRKFTGKSPSAARCGVKAGEFDNYNEKSL